MPTSLRSTYDSIRSTNRQELMGLAGRAVDADALLEGGMSEGLRDWDLWGPLVFCLLLSLFLSFAAASEQKSLVFSGVFAMVWIGEAVVTAQIKLLGGNMYVPLHFRCTLITKIMNIALSRSQYVSLVTPYFQL